MIQRIPPSHHSQRSHLSPVMKKDPTLSASSPTENKDSSNPIILLALGNSTAYKQLNEDLCSEGYQVEAAANGEKALQIAEHVPLSLALIDLHLPLHDGLDLCRVLRNQRITAYIPIMLLAPSIDEAEMIIGLEVGADEYLLFPAHWRVLRARIRALLRRSKYTQLNALIQEELDSKSKQSNTIMEIGDLMINLAGHEVSRRGKSIELSARLFCLLLFFVRHQGKVVTRKQLVEQLQVGEDTLLDERSIDGYVHWLREKLEEDTANPRYIHTLRGIGYRFTV